MSRFILKAANSFLNLIVVMSLFLAASYAGYALWDNNQVYAAAENVQDSMIKLKPVVTEKSMNAMAEKKYTFLVHTDATKNQIKEAVEKMFEGTKVKSVNTMNQDGKNRRRGMVVGKTSKTKKAIVTLTADSKDIEIFEGL